MTKNTSFTLLTKIEREGILARLSTLESKEISIWSKGDSERNKISNFKYFKEHEQLVLRAEKISAIENALYTFEINGIHYFGTGSTKRVDSHYVLTCKSDLYKSERRANFRLLTYPHRKVYLQLKLNYEGEAESNVLNLATRKNDTNLFKSFLSLVGPGEDELIRKGYLRFRVMDISSTGISIRFSEIEKKILDSHEGNLLDMYINFEGDELKVSEGKLLYQIDYLTQKKTRYFKGGVKFLGIDTNFDSKISKKINEVLRSTESEFEDFL